MPDTFDGSVTMKLSQADLVKAIAYWLNTEVLSMPAEVVRVERNTDHAGNPLQVDVHLTAVADDGG